MAAAGRDVSLAPSIQLPCDGLSPCFIIIPIISLGGGPRPRSPSDALSLSLPPSLTHSAVLAPIPPVTCSMKFKYACSKSYSSTKALPSMTRCRSASCLHPLKYESSRAAKSTRASICETKVLDLLTRRQSRLTEGRVGVSYA